MWAAASKTALTTCRYDCTYDRTQQVHMLSNISMNILNFHNHRWQYNGKNFHVSFLKHLKEVFIMQEHVNPILYT